MPPTNNRSIESSHPLPTNSHLDNYPVEWNIFSNFIFAPNIVLLFGTILITIIYRCKFWSSHLFLKTEMRKIIVLKLSNFFFISKGRTVPEQQQHPSFNRFSSFRTETALHVSLARKSHLSISDFVKTKNFF